MHQKQQQLQQQQQRQQQQCQNSNVPQNTSPQSKSKTILRHKSLPTSLNSRSEKVSPQSGQMSQSSSTQIPVSSSSPSLQQRKQRESPSSPKKRIPTSINQRARSSESIVSRTPPVARRHPQQQQQSDQNQGKAIQRKQVKDKAPINDHQQQLNLNKEKNDKEQESKAYHHEQSHTLHDKLSLEGQNGNNSTSKSVQSKNIPIPSPLMPRSQSKEVMQDQRKQNHPPPSPKLQRGADSPKLKSAIPKQKPSRQDLALSLSSQQKNLGQKSVTSPTSPPGTCRTRPMSPLTIPTSPSSLQKLPPQSSIPPSSSSQKLSPQSPILDHKASSLQDSLRPKNYHNHHHHQQQQQCLPQYSPKAMNYEAGSLLIEQQQKNQQQPKYQQFSQSNPSNGSNNQQASHHQQHIYQQYQDFNQQEHQAQQSQQLQKHEQDKQQIDHNPQHPLYKLNDGSLRNPIQQQQRQEKQNHPHQHQMNQYLEKTQHLPPAEAAHLQARTDQLLPIDSWLSPAQRQEVYSNKDFYNARPDMLVNHGVLCVTTASVYDSWDSEDGEESLV